MRLYVDSSLQAPNTNGLKDILNHEAQNRLITPKHLSAWRHYKVDLISAMESSNPTRLGVDANSEQ